MSEDEISSLSSQSDDWKRVRAHHIGSGEISMGGMNCASTPTEINNHTCVKLQGASKLS